jgi:hypothetical protein
LQILQFKINISDSDDEMSDDLENTAIDNPKTAKYSQLQRSIFIVFECT